MLLAFPAMRAAAEDPAPEALSVRFRAAARRALPSVVSVRAELGPNASPLGVPMPASLVPRDPGGSGVVIDATRGLVLTNDHVVQGAARVVVTLHDGRQRVVKEVRRDPRSDLALLIVPADGLHAATWGDSDALDLGDWVLAVGQPFGLADSVTAGIVSGTGRGIASAVYEDLIQTDAAINPGNSGGPLVNLRGEVVGINTAIKTLSGGYEGIGFAVPSNRARRVADDLAETGRVRRASLGVLIGRIDPEAAERLGNPGAVPITGVAPLGPAAQAGLVAGDVVLEVDGRPVRGVGSLQARIEVAPVGEPLALRIARGAERREVIVRPVAQGEVGLPVEPMPIPMPAPAPAAPPPAPAGAARPLPEPADASRSPTRFPALGLRLSEPTAELARQFGHEATPPGLFVRGVEPDGPADRAGLEIGMVITDLDGRPARTLADVRAAMAERPAGRDLILRILRGTKAEFRVILAESLPGADAPPP
jgi:serine protease Do